MFLLRAHRASQKRILLDHWLLLALRTLILVALGVAIARPFLSGPRASWMSAKAAQDRVIILDDSLSMRARRDDGMSSFDAARRQAQKLLDAMKDRDRVALVTTSVPARAAVDHPIHDANIVRQWLENARCSAMTGDVASALHVADEVLGRGNAELGSRTVYVLTDRCASALNDSPVSSAASHANIDRVVVVDVGPAARRNLSLRNPRLETPVVGLHVPIRMAYEVVNQSDIEAGGRVRISVDGRLAVTRSIESVSPRAASVDRADVSFDSPGCHVVTLSLESEGGDALLDDDTIRLAVEVPGTMPVLLVEGNPSKPSVEQDLFFFRVALSSQTGVSENQVGPADRAFLTRVVSPADLETELLTETRVVVLGNVSHLSTGAWERLNRFVASGGGLIMLLGPNVDAAHYNRFAFSVREEGSELPGGPRHRTGQSGDPAATASSNDAASSDQGWLTIGATLAIEDGAPERTLRLDDSTHPIFTDFTGFDDGGLKTAKFRQFHRLEPAAGDASPTNDMVDVPVRFDTGESAMVERRAGQGRVIVMASGLTVESSSLPAMPDFVPFILNLTAFAAGDDSARLNRKTGEPITTRGRSMAMNEPVTVVEPDGTSAAAAVEPSGDALVLRYDGTNEAGVYRMTQGGGVELFAVNIRDDESDLRAADDQAVRAFFGPDTSITKSISEPEARVIRRGASEFGGVAMYLLVALVLVETFVATNSGPRP